MAVNIFGSLPLMRRIVRSIADAVGPEAADRWYEYYAEEMPHKAVALRRAMFTGLVGPHAKAGLKYGEMLLPDLGDADFIRVLANKYHLLGYLERPYELEEEYARLTGERSVAIMLRGKVNLLRHGYPLPAHDPTATYTPKPRRVLYLLHNSLPFASGGYATRSHGLMMSLRREHWNVSGVTRLGFPTDVLKLDVDEAPTESVIDGIHYRRLPTREYGYSRTPADEFIGHYLDAASGLVKRERPLIIHGASNYVNGIVATGIAHRFGIPSIYEVRGLWEVTRGSRQPDWFHSEVYQQIANLETQACMRADRVITITEALRDEMIDRGVDAAKIIVVPNGVNTSRFTPRKPNRDLAERLGLTDKVIIGFVGSMVQYEGLDYLLKALARLRTWGVEGFGALLVGDGAEYPALRSKASDLGLDDVVVFTGRVAHEAVEDYYSIIDIAPFPRKGQPVCEMVSPLKPFEAMAMGKVPVASDVAALAEIVEHDVSGLIHLKDDVDDLTHCLARLIRSPSLRERLGENARQWVVRERDWEALGRRVGDVYEDLEVEFEQGLSRK